MSAFARVAGTGVTVITAGLVIGAFFVFDDPSIVTEGSKFLSAAESLFAGAFIALGCALLVGSLPLLFIGGVRR